VLNPSKAEAIVFGTGARLWTSASAMPRFTITGVDIPFVDSVCMLGITLDSYLSLNKHVANTVASCNFPIRDLRHIRSSLTPRAAVKIACSLVNTRLDYCDSLLVNNTNHNIIRLQHVQSNLARVILCKNCRTSPAPLIHDLHLQEFRINDRIQHKLPSRLLLLMLNVKIEQPSYLSELLCSHVPARSLRSASHLMLYVPLCELKTVQSGFCFSAPIMWNGLSEHVRTSATRDIFVEG